MFKRTLALAALSAIVAAGSVPAGAATESATYVASPGARCCDAFRDAGLAYGVGGYQFIPGGDVSQIRVQDANGPGIVWIACQEVPGEEGETPSTCGDGNDISGGGCSTGAFQNLTQPFRKGLPMNVFILTSNPGVFVGPDCPQIATTGTITLRTI